VFSFLNNTGEENAKGGETTMSAYMVADATINRVVPCLALEVFRNAWFKAKVEQTLGIDTAKSNWGAELGKAMFKLNIAGVNARYGQGKAKQFRKLDYRYTAEYSPKVQVFKSLRCWLYQCTEGDVYKRPFYQAFDSLIADYLMRQIIADLPEYQNAEWG